MRRGDHLREVNERWTVLFIEHEVELVEISMNEATIGQMNNQVHQVVVEQRRILQGVHLAPAIQIKSRDLKHLCTHAVCCCNGVCV